MCTDQLTHRAPEGPDRQPAPADRPTGGSALTPALTAAQVQLLRDSWEQVRDMGDEAGEWFYCHLFVLAPHLRPLFKGDMRRQAAMLLAMLEGVVSALDQLDSVLPAARKLAIRHVAWGVKAEHYDGVGAALMLTLEQGLGERFCPLTRQAWAAAYNTLSGVMKEAAYPGPVVIDLH
jgi:hemoglobin-like flavoprotein